MFKKLCLDLKVKYLTLTAYHPQKNGHVTFCNKSLIRWLRHCISVHQTNRDEHVQPPIYAYHTQVYVLIVSTLFRLVFSGQQPPLLTVAPMRVLPTGTYRDTPPRELRLRLLARMVALKKIVDVQISATQSQYDKDFEKFVQTLLIFEVVQLIYVNMLPRAVLASETDEVATASYNKLLPEW